jgi:hypothetical protein
MGSHAHLPPFPLAPASLIANTTCVPPGILTASQVQLVASPVTAPGERILPPGIKPITFAGGM